MSSARTDHDDRPCQLVLTVVRTDRCQNGPMLEWTQISDVLGQQMLVHLIQTENLAVPTTNASSGTTNRAEIDGTDRYVAGWYRPMPERTDAGTDLII